MRISEAFPSEFLKSADLQGRNINVVIERVEMRDLNGDEKPVLFFQGKTKGVVLNKTNSTNIALAYGDDTDEWTGKEVVLYETMVDFQGRSVPAIRIRVPRPGDRRPPAPPAAAAATKAPPPAQIPPMRDALDDEIPF